MLCAKPLIAERLIKNIVFSRFKHTVCAPKEEAAGTSSYSERPCLILIGPYIRDCPGKHQGKEEEV
jgi:hypothetical protein